MQFETIKETPMTFAEVRKSLEKIKKKEEELNFRAAKTEDYLNQFAQLSVKKTKEMIEDINKLNITRLKDAHTAKLADLIPTHDKDIKVILQSFNVTLSADQVKKLAGVLQKYASEA